MRKALRYSLLLLTALVCTAPIAAADDRPLDMGAWQALPVLSGGRIVPLDTYARAMAESVCGRQNPKLWLSQTASSAEKAAPGYAAAKELFPGGQPRRFTAAELLFSWLVEPERWRCVPFLTAAHKQLRTEVLEVPSGDDVGRLRFISPYEAEHNPGLARRWEQIAAKAGPKPLEGADRKIQELVEGLSSFRAITETPSRDSQPPKAHIESLQGASLAWRRMAGVLKTADRLSADDPLGKLLIDAGASLQKLLVPLQAMAHGTEGVEYSWKETAEAATGFAVACDAIAAKAAAGGEKAAMVETAAELKQLSFATACALYETAESPRMVPSLDPRMADEDRDAMADNHPWISLSLVLDAPMALLKEYPQAELGAVRREFAAAKAAWLDHGASDRSERFDKAMTGFAAALRALGEKTAAMREELPLARKDQKLLADTNYPQPGAMRAELFYNRLDPFFWSWIISVVALAILALAFGRARKPLFWIGLMALLTAQLMTFTGFALRTSITGLLPLTGMFESVSLVGVSVVLLGLWFTVLPLVWPGLRLGWQVSAITLRGGETAMDSALVSSAAGRVASWLVQGPRLALAVALLWFLSLRSEGRPAYFELLPRPVIGAALPSLDNIVVWLVSTAVLLGVVYYLPRLAVSLAIAPWTIPAALRREGLAKAADQVLGRKILVLVGAVIGVVAALMAYYAPSSILDREITRPQPVLRDNFWLFTHVLTIFFSYAAGGLAWGLSNISLAFYLFGAYRHAPATDNEDYQPAGTLDDAPQAKLMDPVENSATTQAVFSRETHNQLPPAECATLAGYTYKATQVAVLLLAAGTLLGALWADKSWGRFWSWDSKEVWSLLTLLAYMVILHGRHIGWFGNFGLAVGSVIGGSFIIMAWFGVNFLLRSGLHSYGAGVGDQWLVAVVAAVAVVLNCIFMAFAAARYLTQSRG